MVSIRESAKKSHFSKLAAMFRFGAARLRFSATPHVAPGTLARLTSPERRRLPASNPERLQRDLDSPSAARHEAFGLGTRRPLLACVSRTCHARLFARGFNSGWRGFPFLLERTAALAPLRNVLAPHRSIPAVLRKGGSVRPSVSRQIRTSRRPIGPPGHDPVESGHRGHALRRSLRFAVFAVASARQTGSVPQSIGAVCRGGGWGVC